MKFRYLKILFLICVISNDAVAETSQPEETPLSYLQNSLSQEQTHARVWYYGWLGFNALGAAASYAVAGTSHDPVVRATQRVSGTQALLGVAAMVLSPIPSTHAATTLKETPEATPEEKDTKQKMAEEFLKQSAETEDFGTSWISHALSLGVAGAGGAAIRYGYAAPIRRAGGSPIREANINFWSTLILGEIQIFTQPTQSVQRWRDYKQKFGPKSFNLNDPDFCFLVRPMSDGFQAGVGFSF